MVQMSLQARKSKSRELSIFAKKKGMAVRHPLLKLREIFETLTSGKACARNRRRHQRCRRDRVRHHPRRHRLFSAAPR
jgi:hypothetical protein